MYKNLGVLILLCCMGCGGGPNAGQKTASAQPAQPDPAVEASKYAKDPGLLRQKAEEFWQKHQYKEAVAFLEPIVKMAPESAEGQYSLAFSDQLSGDNQQAVDHYTKALQLGYAEFWVKYNRSAAYLALGDKAKAREDLVRAQQLDPTSAGVKAYLKQLEK
jgi:tetratricopeptide (TPR) repeat protein